jgi:hypothetical protein
MAIVKDSHIKVGGTYICFDSAFEVIKIISTKDLEEENPKVEKTYTPTMDCYSELCTALLDAYNFLMNHPTLSRFFAIHYLVEELDWLAKNLFGQNYAREDSCPLV